MGTPSSAVTGTVDMGTGTCSSATYSGGNIVCTAPAGQGTVDVEVTLSGTTSAAIQISYAAPTISSIVTASNAITDGGFDAVIYGTNFGDAPAVTFAGAACTDVVVTSGSTVITCTGIHYLYCESMTVCA